MLKHGDALGGQQLRDFLALAQHVRFDDGRGAIGQRLANDGKKLFEHFLPRRQTVVGMSVSAFDHEDVGVRQFGHSGGGRLAQLEIARVKQRLSAVFGQKHGGAETMAGGKSRQSQPAPLDRLSVGHRQRRPRT